LKQFTLLIIFLASNLAYSQNTFKWSRTGDSATTNDWIGTKTNEPLLLKANNNLGIKIKTNGELMFKSLDLNSNNGPDGFVLTDGQGRIFRFNFSGNTNQFLMGNGTWGTLPLSITSFSATGNQITTASRLTVGGDIVAQNKLLVTNDASFNGNIKNTFLAGAGDKLVYADANGNLKVIPSPATPCVAGALPWYEGGNSSPVNNTIGTCTNIDFILKANNLNSIWIKPDKKVGINTPVPTAQLDVTNIGLETGIKFNSSTGSAAAMEFVQISTPTFSRFKTFADGRTYIGRFASPANDYDQNSSILVVGQQLKNLKALELVDNTISSNPIDYFSVYGSGYTEIKANLPNATDNAFAIMDANNFNIVNFKIKKNGNVQIGNKSSVLHPNSELLVNGTITCKELYVTKPSDWPDYVFESNYKLLSLNEVEDFYKIKKHLPNVPSEKELSEKDLSVGEMNTILLLKIEELTIYIVELNKELKQVKKDIKILKNK
jgi:hypothetical protein